jgi:hypothetical protein
MNTNGARSRRASGANDAGGRVRALVRRLAFAAMGSVLVSGCIGSQGAVQSEREDFNSKFPAVTVSDSRIHSPTGDMSARLPEGWVTLDVDKLDSPDLFAVACNPDYTMSLIFSATSVDNAARRGFDRGGMAGLAEASFERHRKRSGGRAALLSEYEEFTIGRRRFGAYTYSTDSNRTLTRVAVFYTASNLYECAVTHLTFSDRDLPSMQTLREVHQLVLSTVEW